MKRNTLRLVLYKVVFIILIASSCKESELTPVRVVAELNTGESRDIKLSNGDIVKLSLLEIKEVRDSLRNAIRAAFIRISIDGEEITLNTGTYNLPVSVGKVKIDCPSVKGFNPIENEEPGRPDWDARFRLWPKGSAYIKAGTFVYPIKQKWFASMTQSGNEPTYVDWGEGSVDKNIYYHYGHDIGGAEGMDEIVSATDGLVVSSNKDILEGYNDFPGDIRMDVVYIVNNLGWYFRYSHLDSTDPAIKPGNTVKKGQRIGFIGKQGGSGGWVHLHFQISYKSISTSTWVTEDAYVYCWESYVSQYNPELIAVARPHHLLWTGQDAILDGMKSKSFKGTIVKYEWIFCDGTTAEGAVQKKSYQTAGEYSEILKVTDSKGNIDYDFTVIQVYDREKPEKAIPVMQPAYHPTLNIKPGDPVTFLVRTFNTDYGKEVWNFGDGSPQIEVKSEYVDPKHYTEGKFAETVHSFANPGHYIVRVERSDESGLKAIAHLHVVVGVK